MKIFKDTEGDADRRRRLGGDSEQGFTVWLSKMEAEQIMAGDRSTIRELAINLQEENRRS